MSPSLAVPVRQALSSDNYHFSKFIFKRPGLLSVSVVSRTSRIHCLQILLLPRLFPNSPNSALTNFPLLYFLHPRCVRYLGCFVLCTQITTGIKTFQSGLIPSFLLHVPTLCNFATLCAYTICLHLLLPFIFFQSRIPMTFKSFMMSSLHLCRDQPKGLLPAEYSSHIRLKRLSP